MQKKIIKKIKELDNEYPIIRPLIAHHYKQAKELDVLSGNEVAREICELFEDETNDYSWGLFLESDLVGYCTIGGADFLEETLNDCPGYTNNSFLLSDVYIRPEYRGKGYGLKMVNEVIKLRTANEKELVFITLLNNELSKFYEKIDFRWYNEDKGIMVRDTRK